MCLFPMRIALFLRFHRETGIKYPSNFLCIFTLVRLQRGTCLNDGVLQIDYRLILRYTVKKNSFGEKISWPVFSARMGESSPSRGIQGKRPMKTPSWSHSSLDMWVWSMIDRLIRFQMPRWRRITYLPGTNLDTISASSTLHTLTISQKRQL